MGTNTVMPRIQPQRFYLILDVKSGGSIRGGNRGGGGNKFRPEKAKLLQFFIQKYAFLCCLNDEIFPLLLIIHVNFVIIQN